MNTYIQYCQFKWLISRVCRQLNESYLPVINDADIYNKGGYQSDDSNLSVINNLDTYDGNYVQRKWHKVCCQLDDSNYIPINVAYMVTCKQLKEKKGTQGAVASTPQITLLCFCADRIVFLSAPGKV